MPKGYQIPQCSDKDRLLIEEWAKSRTMESRLVERAKIIQRCLGGEPIKKIVQELKVRPNTVIDWRRRFDAKGIAGLTDLPRSGKPPKYTAEFRNEVLATLEIPPPLGQSVWDGPAVAKHLGASVHAVWRVLRKEGICLSRQRSWCVSTDPEFAAKAADIVGLYLNPPEKALVISVDEKPSMQALERSTGYVETDNGKIVRGFKSTYMTGREVHVVLDNYCIHKRNNAWLATHPNVFFHFAPTSASWLNQVEIWFGIMSRKALRGASFKSTEDLAKAISDFITAYGLTAKPFIWRKREVKGSQLKNTIVNLRN